jgi:hypothetical protein
MDSDRWDSRKDDERTRNFRLLLSQSLNERFYGNVEFYHSSNPGAPKLYAFSHIWEYPAFKSCGTLLLHEQADNKSSTHVFPGNENPKYQLKVAPPRGDRPRGDRKGIAAPSPSQLAEAFPSPTISTYSNMYCAISTPIRSALSRRQTPRMTLTCGR